MKDKMVSDPEPVEYEQVTLRIPKKIMDFLRLTQKLNHEDPEKYLLHSLVDMVRADIDAGDVFVPEVPEPAEVARIHGLTPVFKEVLGYSFYSC
jgi:hypothetical protein